MVGELREKSKTVTTAQDCVSIGKLNVTIVTTAWPNKTVIHDFIQVIIKIFLQLKIKTNYTKIHWNHLTYCVDTNRTDIFYW